MRIGHSYGKLAFAAGILLACSTLSVHAAETDANGLGTLHFGSSDVVPCQLRTHRIGSNATSSSFVHPAPSCVTEKWPSAASRVRSPFETSATWQTGYSDVDFAVGVVYRALPRSPRNRLSSSAETVSLVGALHYGGLALGASIFDAGDPVIERVRHGYNFGANYHFGAFRVGTSLVTTWTDGSWTGAAVGSAPQQSIDSLSVDLQYAFTPGFLGYFNYVEVSRPEHQLQGRDERTGERESTWTIGLSLGF